MKQLEIYLTSNLQQQIDSDLTGRILAMLIPLFRLYPFDMFVIEPDEQEKLQIRLAGYNFFTHELDEKTIISGTELPGERVIWLKVDDYGDVYIGTLLLSEDY